MFGPNKTENTQISPRHEATQQNKVVRTAIFPVAGLGTRFLPATKATPKELLPVLDTPLLQYAIDEVREAGVERLVFVSHPSKSAIEKYVFDDRRLRQKLNAAGKARAADLLHRAALTEDRDDALFVMQPEPLGLGHAVLSARDCALPGAVAVILPDDLILGTPGCLTEMIDAYQASGTGHMVAAEDVAPEDTARYGIFNTIAEAGPLVYADGVVEKPDPSAAPSNTAVVGRYILDDSIFSDLEVQAAGRGGEIQLTDAIARGAARVGLSGFRFSGRRFDCGSKAGMLSATLFCAASDPACESVLHAHSVSSEAAA